MTPPRTSLRRLTHSAFRPPWMAGLLALAAAGWASEPAVSQVTAGSPASRDKTGEIDRIFSALKSDAPGCAIAVSKDGKRIASRAYGSADLERKTPITPDTVFDIGSVHKQFVAASVLLLVEDRKLALTDDIRKYLPELPAYARTITIDHLLMHTSGLRDWTALLPLASDKPTALAAILRQRGTNFAPGDQWAYSNSNYVVLKEIVARVSGQSFADFSRKRIFEPLGMKASSYSVDMLGDIRNRAYAYEKQPDGTWKVSMRVDNERGGGGVLSTPGDMLIWNEALTTARLGKFVTGKLQETAKLNNGRTLRYARGLIVDSDRGMKMVWHSGGSAGYNAWLGRYPDFGLSLALACNHDVDGGSLVRGVFDLFLPADAPKPTPYPAPTPDPDLAARAGLFVSDADGELLRLGVARGRLAIAGGPPLLSTGPARYGLPDGELFFRSQDAFDMRFISVDEFEMKSMEGKVTRYRRAQPWTPTEAEMQALAGRYESKELNTVFVLTPDRDVLAARLEHAPERALPFRPVLRDVFQVSQATLRPVRDATGKVIAIDYGNPAISGVRLSRLP